MEQDILLIDKPSGITSYDVIRKLKPRFTKGTKLGHAGTLDPRATGLMIIGVGPGTKKLNEYLKLPKVYEAEVLFGLKTDTGDLDGQIIEKKIITESDLANFGDVISEMKGKIKIAVPSYSAIKIKGKPLYKYAREGKDIAPPEKEMEIISYELRGLNCDPESCTAKIIFEVASGTYIRSLAEELGRRLEIPATLASLRRTKIGDFSIEDAEKI
jgi:tRNA pseudouridine55 synthase